jgi:hypothetical protein
MEGMRPLAFAFNARAASNRDEDCLYLNVGTPRPTMKRPPDNSARLTAVKAFIAGVRAGIYMMAVPTFTLSVCASIQAAGVMASDP